MITSIIMAGFLVVMALIKLVEAGLWLWRKIGEEQERLARWELVAIEYESGAVIQVKQGDYEEYRRVVIKD